MPPTVPGFPGEMPNPPREPARRRPPTAAQLQKAVNNWNKKYPPGQRVQRYRLTNPLSEPEDTPTTTTSAAWILSGHSAVVMVASISGCVGIDSLVPLKDEPAAASTPNLS